MINLLPPDTKREIKAARINVILVRYAILFTTALLMMLGIFVWGIWTTQRDRQAAEDRKVQITADTAQYAKVKSRAEAFAKDLDAAKTILSGEVSYSKLLIDIANILPPNTVVSSLNLVGTNFGTPVTISAQAVTNPDVLRLKTDLEASDLFEKVSITNTSAIVKGTEPGAPVTKYEINVTISAILSKPAAPSSTTPGAKP
jgi:Tfp pilus assembly protein PilN